MGGEPNICVPFILVPNFLRWNIHLYFSFSFAIKLETLENLSPAILSSVGMLCMNTSDVNWPLLVERWLAKRPEREVDVLRELCDRYIGPTLEYLASKTSVPPISGAPPTQNKPSQLRHVVSVTEMGMVNTLLTLVEVGVVMPNN